MKTVYVETSIVSYLTARPARDLIAAAWQNATNSWWETQRIRFELYASELVVEEAEQGDHDAASRRLSVLSQLPHLAMTDEVIELASALLDAGALPHAATGDAIHVALAAYHGVDYLLTWNCRHIDNAEMKPLIRAVCMKNGYQYPEICTPLELMGAQDND